MGGKIGIFGLPNVTEQMSWAAQHDQWLNDPWGALQQEGLALGLMGIPLQRVEAKFVYKTQKARGLEAGWALSSLSGYGYKVAPHHGVMPHLGPLALGELKFPKFARPCPITPRHGFVESRDVNNIHELEALFKETREHDPEGELIIMDRLSGKYSAVMTAGGVSWGLSNDGVTGGHDGARTIPTPAGRFDATFLPYLGQKPNDETQGVYAELVEDKGAVCVVQMRLGPRQPDSRVKRICVGLSNQIQYILSPTSDDLIEWDNRLSEDKFRVRQQRTLVWLPGQTMASHFAVQGIAKGYNVSVEDKCPVDPKFGGLLKPESGAMAPLSEEDFRTLGDLFEREKNTRFWDFPRDVLLSVGVLHSLPYWDNSPHLLALRARGAMIAARYGLAACLGESRHKLHMSTNPSKVPWKKLMGEDVEIGSRPSRSYVFVRSFSMPWADGPSLALAAAEDMRLTGQLPVMDYLAKGGKLGDYSASFMGHKWEWAALRCHDLHKAIDRFTNEPNNDNWNVVLGHYNEIINAAHNGGYLLNKWCAPNLIDAAATMPAVVFGFRNVMGVVWGDQREEPRVPWLAMSQKPPAGHDDFVETDEGMLIPVMVWKQMETDGVILPGIDNCKCKQCLKFKWEPIGNAAMFQGTPCYVPDKLMPTMPKISLGDDHYSISIAAITTEASTVTTEPVESDGSAEICDECDCNLEDGECPNEDCCLSPNYTVKEDDTPEMHQEETTAEESPDGDDVSKA